MSVRDLNAADAPQTSRRAEICIVGAGIAGLILGTRLARAGRDVVVLESGRRQPDEPHEALNGIEDANGLYVGAQVGRTRALGGTSSLWGGRMLPLTEGDMSARPALDLPAWPISPADLNRYRPDIERLFGVDGLSFERDFLGQAGRHDPFPGDDPDFVTRWPKWPDFRKCNLSILLRDDIGRSGGVEIWTDATVRDFTLDEAAGRLGAVEAVSLGGRRLSVSADEFVLTAGTIETTRLLLWLDARSGGRAFAGGTALGRYFQDHVTTTFGRLDASDRPAATRLFGFHFLEATRRSLHFETTSAAQEADRVASAFVQIVIEPSESSPLNVIKNFLRGLQRRQLDLPAAQVLRLAGEVPNLTRMALWRYLRKRLYLPADTDLIVSAVVEQLPRASNRVLLSESRDATDLPVARLEWGISEDDLRCFRSAATRIDRYWTRAGFDRTCPIRWNDGLPPGEGVQPKAGMDISHPSGSFRMGTDPATSVVDPDLRCHGVRNLTAVGAGVFPTAGSANPTYTIMQLALRAADRISARFLKVAA